MNKISIPGFGKAELRIFESAVNTYLYSFNESYSEVKPNKLMPSRTLKPFIQEEEYEENGVHVLLQEQFNSKILIDEVIVTQLSSQKEYLPEEFISKWVMIPNSLIQVDLELESGDIINIIEDYSSSALIYFIDSLIKSPEFLCDYYKIVRTFKAISKLYPHYRLPFHIGIENYRKLDGEAAYLDCPKFIKKFGSGMSCIYDSKSFTSLMKSTRRKI